MTDGERPYLLEALRSVRVQQVPCDVRLYVTEENEWVEDIVKEVPEILLRRIARQSAAGTRNLAVREAATEWVAFLDGDDVWQPGKLARQLRFADDKKTDFVGADHCIVDADGRMVAYGLARYLPMTSSWLVRRDVMLTHPFPDVPRHEDGAWWLATLDRVQRRRLPEFLLRYRVRPDSQSWDARPLKARLVALAGHPGLRPLLCLGSSVLHRLHKSSYYDYHPAWRLADAQPAESHQTGMQLLRGAANPNGTAEPSRRYRGRLERQSPNCGT